MTVPTGAVARAVRDWPDGDVLITIRPKQEARNKAQHAYYHGVVIKMIADFTGYDEDEAHELMKSLLLPKHLTIADANGEIVDERVIGGSITKLSGPEFSEYIDRVREYAATTMGLFIPDPIQRGEA